MPIPANGNLEFINAVDISRYPEISHTNPIFYDLDGYQKDFLIILKENGVNIVRLRICVNPLDEYSGFKEVRQFSQTLKDDGFKIWQPFIIPIPGQTQNIKKLHYNGKE